MKTITILTWALVAFAALFPRLATAKTIYNELPTTVDAQKNYVFYSHGYIVEGDDPMPEDTRFGWGVYDFPAIKAALADDSYVLVATHRAKNTNPFEYAAGLDKDIRRLVAAGVPAEHITIVGFSRGAFITGVTSNLLADVGVNTVILAGCGRLISPRHDDIQVYGHVLSVYENSDRANTCQKLKDKSNAIKSFTEIEINTGLEHGAFYRPLAAWVEPVKQWMLTRHTD